MKWFKREKFVPPTTPVVYPSGSCVRTEKGEFYIKGGMRYRIPSQRILFSWKFRTIIQASEASVAKYKLAGKVGFRDGSLLRDFGSGKLYVISDSKKRLISNPDILDCWGITVNEFVDVSTDEINIHRDGEDIK